MRNGNQVPRSEKVLVNLRTRQRRMEQVIPGRGKRVFTAALNSTNQKAMGMALTSFTRKSASGSWWGKSKQIVAQRKRRMRMRRRLRKSNAMV